MKRREFLKRLGQTTLAVSAVGGLSCATTKKRPNIIYILVDDLGYGDLSCYGQTRFTTPNIDNMAAEGMKFTDHYCGSTVCAPSRASLMTGMHTGHGRVRGNYETGPHGFGACLELRPQDKTIAEYLKPLGYKTGLFGKWGLGVMTTTGQPDKKGFDEWFGYLNQGNAHFFYPEYLWKNGEKYMLEGNENGGQKQYSHDLITAEALSFVKKNKDNPFFMYFAITIPHAEMLVPEDSIKPFKGKWAETPFNEDGTQHYGRQMTPRAAFAGMVTRMDRDIGRLFDLLKELNIDKNTIVMFASDNGPHLEGGHDPEFFDSNGPLKGFKRDLYEGGIRTPFIVRWPDKVKAGSESHHVSAFWDVLPTVCELAGTSAPADVDGISFAPELVGQKQPKHDYLYWEFHERKYTTQAIRMDNWKAVRQRPSGPIELYDLTKDISEENNIAENHADIVAKMDELFKTTRTPHDIWELKD